MKSAFTSTQSMSRKLKELRLRKGFSMREAAKRIGIPETTYREWEYGRAIQGEPYTKIAQVYDIRLNDLFGVTNHHENSLEQNLERLISDLHRIKDQVISLKK